MLVITKTGNINACLICDQGGECELQDLSLGYGAPDSYFSEGKRAVKDQDIGPLIQTDMTRCIHCTRCVRFGAEVAGMRELGATGRGEHMEIGTYVEHAMHSDVSGNVIDLCPVGALTSKPFRFTARPWELTQRPTVGPHDCIGSNLYAHLRNGKVMRVVPHENIAINETWISDRDRFSYQGLEHADRVAHPLIKKEGVWHTVDWQTALTFAVAGIQQVLHTAGAEQIGALISPNATLEECYLLQKVLRGLGSQHIDYRLRQVDGSDQEASEAFCSTGMSFADIEQSDTIVLIGSNIQKEQPVLSLRLRKAALKGARIIVLNPIDYAFHFDVAEKYIVAPDEMVAAFAKIETALQGATKACVLLGALALNHPEASALRSLSRQMADALNAKFLFLTEGANATGARIAGAIPSVGGFDAARMLVEPRKAYVLVNVEPELDCANPVAATAALRQAEFVVSLSLFNNAVLEEHADVILPIAAFTETSGTFVNAVGEWQSFQGVASAFFEARPAWKVLRVLGNLCHLKDFDYESSEEVRDEVRKLETAAPLIPTAISLPRTQKSSEGSFVRIGEIPIYAGDSLVRRAEALQSAQMIREGDVVAIRMHPDAAAQLNLNEGNVVAVTQQGGSVNLPIVFDSRLPLRGVLIAGGIVETSGLNELFGPVEIELV